MLTKNELINLLKAEQPHLKNEFGVTRIAIFGSFANDTASDTSDVDIYIEFEGRLGMRFIHMINYLEEKLGRTVDVLTPGGIEGIRIQRVADEIKRTMVDV